MMKERISALCCWIFLLYTARADGQEVPFKKVDRVAQLVLQFFNAKQADSIYALTGESFRKELNVSEFRQIAEKQLFPNGDIRELKLDHFEKGTADYEAVFDRSSLRFLLSLDKEGKIYTFLWQPYPEKKLVKQRDIGYDNPLQTKLDRRVHELLMQCLLDSGTAGASIGILKKDSMRFYNYGETKIPAGPLPDKHTLYEIGSITKTFTSLLLADAVQENRLKLADEVNRYLPPSIKPLEFNDTAIAVVNLANHSSGLPRMPTNMLFADPKDPYAKYDTVALYWFLNHVQLSRTAGSQYEYSNLAAGLLGVILERLYTQSFSQLLTEKILEPLQMTATRQSLTPADSSHFATPYDAQGKETSPWNFMALAAAGAIRSNTEDLLRYAAFYLNPPDNALGDAAKLTQELSFAKGGQRVGLGWHFFQMGPARIAQHSGGTGGFRSFMAFDPQTQTAVVILSNSAARDYTNTGLALMKELAEE